MAPDEHPPVARILSTADRLFYEQGFGATGVNQIVVEAEVAKDSFYRHFPSKEDLVVAYLENRHEAFSAELSRSVEARRSPAKRVLALFDSTADWLQATDFRGCAFQNALAEFSNPESAPRQVVRKVKSEQRAYITRLCSEAGHKSIGKQVFLLLEGAISQAAIRRNDKPVCEARRAVKQWLAG